MFRYDRIKQRAKELGITLSFINKKLGVAPAYLSDMNCKGLNLPEEKMVVVAELLNVSAAYLRGESDDPVGEDLLDEVNEIDDDLLEQCGDVYHAKIAQRERDKQKKHPDHEAPNAVFLSESVVMLPLYESVSAGLGAYASENVVDYIPCYLPNKEDAPNYFCLRVRGDSMYPKIEDGDIIEVEKTESVDSGSLAVIRVDGDEGFVKRVEYDAENIVLQSINPMYPPIHFEGRDVLRVKVCGRVRKIIKDC